MSAERKPMGFWEGLAYLFRFDVLSANWRHVLSSFAVPAVAVALWAAPIVADVAYKELKKRGVFSEGHSSGKRFEVTYLDRAGRKHIEQIEDDIRFYERVRQEGLTVISIHKIS